MLELSFAIGYITLLCVPGLALHRLLLTEHPNSIVLSVALSFAWFCACFIVIKLTGGTAYHLSILLAASVLTSFIYLAKSEKKDKTKLNISSDSLVLISIVLSNLLLQVVAGPYLEVPADIFAHLERYQNALKQIEIGSLGYPISLPQLFKQGSGLYYYLAALITHGLDLPLVNVVSTLDFIHRTLFLCVVYAFSRQVFADEKHSVNIAIICVMFVILHMGINVFAFVRYYSLAPVMLNLSLYFAMVSVFLNILQIGNWRTSLKGYSLIVLLAAIASAVHVQEAMFAAVMIACIVAVVLFSQLVGRSTRASVKTNKAHLPAMAFIILLLFAAVYIYSWLNLERAPNAHWRLWEFGQLVDFLPAISTLNLKFQFARTMTLWGFFVGALFLLNFRRYQNNWFILAGMLSPLVTILNPFFVDLFLRQYGSTTLWRLSYLIPIHFVAADLFIMYWRRLISSVGITKLKAAIPLFILVVLLLPVANTWNNVHYSRFPTLFPQQQSNSHKSYVDLLDFLIKLEQPHSVLTDPVTGYLISSSTQHRSQRRKFYRTASFKDFTYPDYKDSPLAKFAGYLLIVNQRDMPLSKVGELGGHWESQPWQHRRYYYTPTLITHLHNNPNRFQRLWSENRVSVYKILN